MPLVCCLSVFLRPYEFETNYGLIRPGKMADECCGTSLACPNWACMSTRMKCKLLRLSKFILLDWFACLFCSLICLFRYSRWPSSALFCFAWWHAFAVLPAGCCTMNKAFFCFVVWSCTKTFTQSRMLFYCVTMPMNSTYTCTLSSIADYSLCWKLAIVTTNIMTILLYHIFTTTFMYSHSIRHT